MKSWKNLLVTAIAFYLVIPVAVYAVDEGPDAYADEAPSFSNPAQAQHAANLASAPINEEEFESAEDSAADTATDTATDYATETATEYATKTATEYATKTATEYATKTATEYTTKTATEYATGVASKDPSVQDALDNLTAAEDALANAQDPKDPDLIKAVEEAQKTYDDAYSGAYDPAYDTVYNKVYDPTYMKVYDPTYNKAYDQAYTKAYDLTYDKSYDIAYDKVYDKALAEELAAIPGMRIEEIHRLRYEVGLGWGQIKHRYRERYDLPNGVLGIGYMKKMPLNKDEVVSPDPEDMLLDAEIAEVTQRSKNNGWNKNQASTKQKGNSKKWIGLKGTSVAADSIVSETVGGKGKGNNGKSDSSAGAGNSNKSKNSSTSVSADNNQPGKDKSNNGKGSKGGNSGKSGSKGNSGKNGNGNNGKGNGNSKK